MTATDARPTPAGLAFAIPADWLAIPPPREQADAARLASEVIAARPRLAGRRPAVERTIRGLIETCASLDLLGAYTTILDVPGGPLPATLVISVSPMRTQTLDGIASELSADDDVVAPPDVRTFDLSAGRTVRVERLRAWPAPSPERQLVSLVVQYVAEIPGTGGAVLLTFATPALALADQLRQVFHQIACTIHFDGWDRSSREPGRSPDEPGRRINGPGSFSEGAGQAL